MQGARERSGERELRELIRGILKEAASPSMHGLSKAIDANHATTVGTFAPRAFALVDVDDVSTTPSSRLGSRGRGLPI